MKHFAQSIPVSVKNHITASRTQLKFLFQSMKQAGEQRIMRENVFLDSLKEKISILSPQNTLKRGYSLTLKDGKTITKADELKAGDRIVTMLANGEVKSIIE